MNDWHVWVWFDHDDPALSEAQRKWPHPHPDQEICGIGPSDRKEVTEAFGLKFVDFLRNAGADLVSGPTPNCFLRRRGAESPAAEPLSTGRRVKPMMKYPEKMMFQDPEAGDPADTMDRKKKAQWVARTHIRFASRYLPVDHLLRVQLAAEDDAIPYHVRPLFGEQALEREHSRNLELLEALYDAGEQASVRPAFWRELARGAGAIRDRDRLERYEARFQQALASRPRGKA